MAYLAPKKYNVSETLLDNDNIITELDILEEAVKTLSENINNLEGKLYPVINKLNLIQGQTTEDIESCHSEVHQRLEVASRNILNLVGIIYTLTERIDL